MPVNKHTFKRYPRRSSQQAFTLIEVVASIVVAALALSALANFFFTQGSRAIEPIFQTRAAKLGEALMDEIIAKPYDENTPVGGVPACDSSSCTPSGSLGLDGEAGREFFDDVDDYHDYCGGPFDIEDALGNSQSDPGNSLEDFDRFKMSVCVGYDDDYNGVLNDAGGINSKLIIVKVYPPDAAGLDMAIEFKAYRGNF